MIGPAGFNLCPEDFIRAWLRHNIRTYNFIQDGAASALSPIAGGLNATAPAGGYAIASSPPILQISQTVAGAGKVGAAAEEFTNDPFSSASSWMFDIPKIIECRFGAFGALAGRGNGMLSGFGFADISGGVSPNEAGFWLIQNHQAQQFEGWLSKGDGVHSTGIVLNGPGFPAYAELASWYRGMIVYNPAANGGQGSVDFYVNGVHGGRIAGDATTFPALGDNWSNIGAGVWCLSGADAAARNICHFMRLSVADITGE